MLTRRTLVKSSIVGALAMGSSLRMTSAQTPVSATFEDGLEYQGALTYMNMPDLPTAPEGECAVVLQAVSEKAESVAMIYHNASDEVRCVNSVTATYIPPPGSKKVNFLPEETIHGPHILQPGDYGISCPAFRWYLEEDGEVEIELDVVPEAEVDPALVSLPIIAIGINKGEGDLEMTNVSLRLLNQTEHYLAENNGWAGIFFSPDGEILGWRTSVSSFDFDPGAGRNSSSSSTSLRASDSFMFVAGGRIKE